MIAEDRTTRGPWIHLRQEYNTGCLCTARRGRGDEGVPGAAVGCGAEAVPLRATYKGGCTDATMFTVRHNRQVGARRPLDVERDPPRRSPSARSLRGRDARYWAPGMQSAVGPPAPMQVKPDAQSVLAAQGKAQRCVPRLHLWVPQMRSFWQGMARGLGAAVAVGCGCACGYWPC